MSENCVEFPYKKKLYIYIGDENCTDVRGFYKFYGSQRHSQKQILNIFKCTGECCQQPSQCYDCKLQKDINLSNNLIRYCPYVYEEKSIKEPRINSSIYMSWKNFETNFSLRRIFKDYAFYVIVNNNKEISDEVYQELKKIDEFKLENIAYIIENRHRRKISFDEIEKNINDNTKYIIPTLFAVDDITFIKNLIQLYTKELVLFQQCRLVRVLLSASEREYLNWKDKQQNPIIIIGDYIMINIISYSPRLDFFEENSHHYPVFHKKYLDRAIDQFEKSSYYYNDEKQFVIESLKNYKENNDQYQFNTSE